MPTSWLAQGKEL